jgi:hypothetical protein
VEQERLSKFRLSAPSARGSSIPRTNSASCCEREAIGANPGQRCVNVQLDIVPSDIPPPAPQFQTLQAPAGETAVGDTRDLYRPTPGDCAPASECRVWYGIVALLQGAFARLLADREDVRLKLVKRFGGLMVLLKLASVWSDSECCGHHLRGVSSTWKWSRVWL